MYTKIRADIRITSLHIDEVILGYTDDKSFKLIGSVFNLNRTNFSKYENLP